MKLRDFQEEVSILKGDQASDTVFGIDGKNMHLAIKAFYQYSDPIGSIIREITSNAYDAHIEAGQDKPVIIRVNQAEDQLHILDFGVGMSPERVKDIYTKFFSSTKRDTNEQIGAFGLGSKSPMSYAEMFQVFTKYEDTVYEHIVHKADGIPNLVTVDEKQYTEEDAWPWEADENGTEIIIPYQHKDESKVINSIRTQLAYFDNIVVDGPEFDVYNNEQIFKGTHFIYRKSKASELQQLHLCVGKVYYPLAGSIETFLQNNFSSPDKLVPWIIDAYDKVHPNADIQQARKTNQPLDDMLTSTTWGSRYYSNNNTMKYLNRANKVPVALYFDIGELPILWHRENIEYTDHAIEMITRRFFEMFFEIQKRQQDRIGPVTSLLDGIEMSVVDEEDLIMGSAAMEMTDTSIHITELKPIVAEYDKIYRNYSTPLWFIDSLYKRHEDSKWAISRNDVGKIAAGSIDVNVYYIEEDDRRKDYLKGYMKNKMEAFAILQLDRNPHNWVSGWGDMDPKHQEVIKKYANEFFDAIEQRVPHVNDVHIPDSYLNSSNISQSKQASSIPLLWRELNAYGGDIRYRRSDLKPIVEGTRPSWKDIKFIPSMLIYGFQDDRKLLNLAAEINTDSMLRKRFNGSAKTYGPRAILGIISKDTAKFIHEICPAVYIKDLLRHRRFLSTPITAYLVNRYLNKHPWLAEQIQKLRTNWKYLLPAGVISQTEYNEIIKVEGASASFHKDDAEQYLRYGLRNKFYHQDEIDLLKWGHGMYLKYWLPLSAHYSVFDGENERYLEQLRTLIPESINPTLHLKHYVNNIRTES